MDIPTMVGDKLETREKSNLISEVGLNVLPIDMIVQWRRCSIVADFLASYLSYLFENRQNAVNVLSSGINELVENLAKFAADKREPVSIVVSHYGEHLRVRTRNVARRAQAEALASRLTRMASMDAEELFLEQLEHTASQDHRASGLGLITMKKDYKALLGAELTPVEGGDELFTVTFTLELDVGAVEEA